MRAIFIFLIFVILLVTSCTSVNVVKEVGKVTQSIEASVKKAFTPYNEKKEEELEIEVVKKETLTDEDEKKQIITIERKEITNEQEKSSEVVMKQKKISTINLLNKTIQELKQKIGHPPLIREDGNTITVRFDSTNCRLFLFMNSSFKTPFVEYYELRNIKGDLIDHKKDIESCFKEMKLV